MIHLRAISTIILSCSIFYFAYSIGQFTVVIKDANNNIPTLISKIESVEKDLNINEWLLVSQKMIDELPAIIQVVSNATNSIDDINKSIPDVLEESRVLRKETINPLISNVERALTDTIPGIRKDLHLYSSKVIPDVLNESKVLRKTVAYPTLTEVSKIREMTPETLDRIEGIVVNAQSTAENISKGAVTGTVKGVVSTPFKLIGDAGEKILPKK
ncbi:hypothetical protein L4D76_16565 [Photobacterium sagamiensis]|uniref:hypothetical protein n=1 Tax=Photobacterium sagamiensis TaxID=2910241 RepID=UPI003D12D6CE